MVMRIETERLYLYPLTTEQLTRALSDITEVARSMGLAMTPNSFFETIKKRNIYKAKLAIIREYPMAWMLTTIWLITDKHGPTVLGEAGFKGPPNLSQIEIGYAMKAEYRNKGIMTEAVSALCEAARHCPDYRVSSVMARTLHDNTPSHRVLEKNSFSRDGFIGKHVKWVKFL